MRKKIALSLAHSPLHFLFFFFRSRKAAESRYVLSLPCLQLPSCFSPSFASLVRSTLQISVERAREVERSRGRSAARGRRSFFPFFAIGAAAVEVAAADSLFLFLAFSLTSLRALISLSSYYFPKQNNTQAAYRALDPQPWAACTRRARGCRLRRSPTSDRRRLGSRRPPQRSARTTKAFFSSTKKRQKLVSDRRSMKERKIGRKALLSRFLVDRIDDVGSCRRRRRRDG